MYFNTLCTNGKAINILHYGYLFSGSSSVMASWLRHIARYYELRQRLLSVWNELEQQFIDNAVDQWRDHLAACVREEGGHFEHTL